MSNQAKLYELFASLKSTKKSFGLLNEAIENAVPKTPTLLTKDEVEFLDHFPEKYWAQALHQRYQKLFNYLTVLNILRKWVYEAEIYAEKDSENQYWNDTKWSNWSKLARDNKALLQSDAKAKSKAVRVFPAGEKIDLNQALNLFTTYYGQLSQNQKQFLTDAITRINTNYLNTGFDEYVNLRVRNEEPKSYGAPSRLGELAKQLEGQYGKFDGYDLNNPRRILAKIGNKKVEPRFVTDTFIFPSLARLKNQINKHIISIGNELARPQDEYDQNRLQNHKVEKHHLTGDQGLNQVAKQLFNNYYRHFMREERKIKSQKEAAGEKYNVSKREAKRKAKEKLYTDLQNYSGENFKKYIQKKFPGIDVSSIQLPYQETEVVTRADGRKAIQNLQPVNVPKQTKTFTRIVNGQQVKEEGKNTVLYQSTLHKPVTLLYVNDSKDPSVDTMQTNLRNVSDALGKKYFDPILFERFHKRINFINKTKDQQKRADTVALLQTYGLSVASSPQDILEASKRYFYQKADIKDYYQGTNVSSTFSLHPTRMSTAANFLHKGHFGQKFENKVDTVLNKGVLVDNAGTTVPTIDFIKNYVVNFLQPTSSDKKLLNKLFLLRAKDILESLCELKLLENLNDNNLFVDIGNDAQPNEFVSANHLKKLLGQELTRYLRQDFFTGSRRVRGDFITQLFDDSKDLSCKVGQRAWQANMCLYGADIRVIAMAASEAMDNIISSVEEASVEEELVQNKSVINARAKVRFVLEEYKKLFQVLIRMYLAKAEKNGKKEKPAKMHAAADLTKFVQDNALNDAQTFVNNFYNEFNNLKSDLVAGDPAAMAAIQIPTELRGKSEEIIKPSTMLRRFTPVSVEGLAERMKENIPLSNEDMNLVVSQYKDFIDKNPNRIQDYKRDLLLKMSKVNATKFKELTNEFDAGITELLRNENHSNNIVAFFKRPLEIHKEAKNPAQLFTWAQNKIKYISNFWLSKVFPLYLDFLYGERKQNFSPEVRKLVVQTAQKIHDEINRRGLKSEIHARLPRNIELLIPYLESE